MRLWPEALIPLHTAYFHKEVKIGKFTMKKNNKQTTDTIKKTWVASILHECSDQLFSCTIILSSLSLSLLFIQVKRTLSRSVKMGCSPSSIDKASLKTSRPDSIPLSKAQKYLLRETWETIELHKKTVGKNTFLR